MYQNLSEEDKNKKRQYVCERYRNIPQDEKQKLVEYRKNFSKMQKLIRTSWFFHWQCQITACNKKTFLLNA